MYLKVLLLLIKGALIIDVQFLELNMGALIINVYFLTLNIRGLVLNVYLIRSASIVELVTYFALK